MTAGRTVRTRRASAGAAVVATALGTFGALAVLAPATAYALPSNCSGTTTVTCSFAYIGAGETWTVPAGVTHAYFDVLGAAGAGPGDSTGSGGLGGETTGTVALTPGALVRIMVGGQGTLGFGLGNTGAGFNGGGPGADGGGGASDVRIGGPDLGNRVLIAGGGGGSAHCSTCTGVATVGGSGGGTVGGAGTSSPNGLGGAGGTQVAGGTGANGAGSGSSGQGGSAGDGDFSGGGGGGYFGGAGGGASIGGPDGIDGGAGGGGSGFFLPDPTRVTGGSTFNGMREGDGSVVLVYTPAPVTATTTTVASSQNPAAPGQAVTFTATVSPNDGTGTVGFFADGSSTALPGCDAATLVDNGGSWQATCPVPGGFTAGNHPIEARYSGADLYLPSTGTLPGGQNVGKMSQTITFPALRNRSIVESPFTLSGVSGGGSGNPVTFTASGNCTVNGAQVTLTHTGSCTVTAHQAGNGQYDAAPDVARTFHVGGPPSLRIGDTSTPEGNSGTHNAYFHVTLSQPVSVPVTVQWHTADGSATSGSDYVASAGTVTFSPGQTDRVVGVPVKGNTTKEPNEVFRVLLTNPHKATIADGTGYGTIVNDD